MADITINDVINDFAKLNESDKEYFLEVANKQLIELKRAKLVDRVKEAESNYQSGNIKKGNADDLLKDLEND